MTRSVSGRGGRRTAAARSPSGRGRRPRSARGPPDGAGVDSRGLVAGPRRGDLREDRRPSARPDLPRGRRHPGRRPGAHRTAAADAAGFDRAQRHGPRLADRRRRPGRARDARGLHDARLPRRAHRRGSSCSTLVTGVVYREPGLLAKAVTTLDVLSGGRAMLGIGAAWNEEESRGLGLPFPPTAERFERLEETLQICLQMWADERRAVRRASTTSSAARSTRRSRCPAAPADPDRRRRREEDAAAGRAVRPGLQPLRRARARRTSSTCCAATASASAATTTRSRRP